MKSQAFLALAIVAVFGLASCKEDNTTSTTTTDSGSTTTVASTTAPTTVTRTITENETYTDLKTGKTFHVVHDASGNWTTDIGIPLDYYYSSVGDTFYGPTARWVNNALIYDPNAGYSIDEVRWQEMNDPEKVKMTDEELKMKSADGETKMKVTDDETKIKTPDMKIKSNEDETKVKQR